MQESQVVFLESVEEGFPLDVLQVFVLLAVRIIEIDAQDTAALLVVRRINPRRLAAALLDSAANLIVICGFGRARHGCLSAALCRVLST